MSKDNPSFMDIVLSVLASMFGVQSAANYKRDFTSGVAVAYIAVAVVMVALFVIALVTLVSLVVPS